MLFKGGTHLALQTPTNHLKPEPTRHHDKPGTCLHCIPTIKPTLFALSAPACPSSHLYLCATPCCLNPQHLPLTCAPTA